jgi:hypothetical protein
MVMTVNAIERVILDVLRKYKLGGGSVRRSSWYVDYACFEFACFATEEMRKEIERAFSDLCDAHDWTYVHVTMPPRANAIHVTLQSGPVISTGDARMPYDVPR